MRNDLYLKTYKNLHPKVKSKISYIQMSQILKDLFLEIFNQIITNNMKFKLPVGLGILKLTQTPMEYKFLEDGSIKRVRSMIDFGASKKLWKEKYGDISKEELKAIKNKPIIFHENEHSNGNIYSFSWTRHPKSRLFFYTVKITRGGFINGLYNGTRGLAAFSKTRGFNTEYYKRAKRK